ncbi:hypothetical protein, partial [Spirosoma migulaei]
MEAIINTYMRLGGLGATIMIILFIATVALGIIIYNQLKYRRLLRKKNAELSEQVIQQEQTIKKQKVQIDRSERVITEQAVKLK